MPDNEFFCICGVGINKNAHVVVFTVGGKYYEGLLWDFPGFHIILRPRSTSEIVAHRPMRLCEAHEEVLIFLDQVVSITVACESVRALEY